MLFCLDRATSRYWETDSEFRKLMFGAVHWFLVSHSYRNQYERFAWIYTVLDTLHRIAWHVSDRYRSRLPDLKGSHGEQAKSSLRNVWIRLCLRRSAIPTRQSEMLLHS